MTPNIVDVHSHLYPPAYIDLLRARKDPPRITGERGFERFVLFAEEARTGGGRRIDATYWDVEEKLAFMDRYGIDQSVISVGNPWLDPIAPEEARDLSRQLNRDLGRLEEQTGGRLCGLGILPSQNLSDALAVAREVAGTAELHGVVTSLRPCGYRLDDPALEPLWGLLEETRLPVFLHPHYGSAIEELTGFGHSLQVGIAFPAETTVAVARMVFAGVLARFQNLKVMVAHGAGTLPYLAGRLDAAWRSDPSTHERLPHPPSRDLAKLYADAVLYHPGAMRAAADVVGTAKLMFGTDHPFSIAEPLTNLEAARAVFDDAELASVMARAAQSFFRLPEVDDRVFASRIASGEN